MRIFVIHKPAVDADNILSLFLQRYPIGEGTLVRSRPREQSYPKNLKFLRN